LREYTSSSLEFQASVNERSKRGRIEVIPLDFDGPVLFGRDLENDILINSLTRVNQPKGASEVITFRGISGTGKTALAISQGTAVGTYCCFHF